MNIIVTGATGYVGYDLVKILLGHGHKIIAIYRNKNLLTKKLLHKNLTWKKFDLKNKFNLKRKADIIIHCAVAHNFSKKNNISDYINSNIISLNNLIDFAKRSKSKMIINFSTVSIYGEINSKYLHEKYIPIKQNILGLTKYFSENILYEQPVNFINIRLPGVLCSRKNNYRPWLQVLINNIKKNRNIDIYNSNNYFNNVIDTQEIGRFIQKIIKRKKTIKDNYNLSASNPIKLKKIIDIVKFKYKSKSKVNNIPNKKKNFLISVKKIQNILNFYPNSTEKIILRNL